MRNHQISRRDLRLRLSARPPAQAADPECYGAGLTKSNDCAVAEARVTPQEAEAHLWHIMRFNLFPMYTWEYSGAITSANDAFLELLGFTRVEYEANGLDWRAQTPPEYLPKDTEAEESLTSEPSFAHEKEFIRKDGRRVRVKVYDSTLPGAPKKGVGIAWPVAE